MNGFLRALPWIILGAGGLFVASKAIPAFDREGEMRINTLGRLPVYDEGRSKPVDSVARSNLLVSSRKQTWTDEDGHQQPAIRWFLDLVCGVEGLKHVVFAHKNLRIENPELLNKLGLPANAESPFYSINEIGPNFRILMADMDRLRDSQKSTPSEYDQAVLGLWKQVQSATDSLSKAPPAYTEKVIRIVNEQVLDLLKLKPRDGFRYSLSEIAPSFDKLQEQSKRASERDNIDREAFDREILDLGRRMQGVVNLANNVTPLVCPPADSQSKTWLTLSQAFEEMRQKGVDNRAARAYGNMLLAYKQADVQAFNRELETYRDEITKAAPDLVKRAGFEAYFNHFEPFMVCTYLYVGEFILACLSWIFWGPALKRSAVYLGLLTFAVHTFGLVARMYLQDRWWVFVTNLYSTAVFIGWATLITATILEGIYKNGIGCAVGALTGALTTLIAHHLAEDRGDTMEKLQAVLDTNFWLATHVTCINAGYSATVLAGFLGCLCIFRGVFTPSLDSVAQKQMSEMIYGITCFATLLSFTGTVLGGIWGDQSWGRFWGWDPKENGAAMVVLINALILHARWAGLIKLRGMACLTVVGCMITGWSWFGTNQLSVGLHAYGFNKELATGVAVSWIIFASILGIGLIPQKYWLSFRLAPLAPKPATASRGQKAKAPVS